MWKHFCRWLLHQRMGWTVDVTEVHPDKYIICLAPHTSNWDFVLGHLYAGSRGWKVNFLMKKEWFFWPLGALFRRMGGIAVERSAKHNMTEQLISAATTAKEFHLCITPEGTRRATTEWKKGFYHIAKATSMPILLYGLDYERRLIECRKTIVPSDDMEADLRSIMTYFKDYRGKNPKNFAVEKI